MKLFFNRLYNFWCLFWFISIFLVLFPFIFICIQFPAINKYGTKLTNFWADAFFFIAGIKVSIEYDYKPDKKQTYMFVANHFSYLDVAIGMKVIRNYFSYMGKSSVKKIPLVGYMFAKLHIQVDRADKNSRAKSIKKSIDALKSGKSLFIMPEGGIISKNIPKMHLPLKDGAFLLAIQAQVPIVPVVFLNLYELMPGIFLKRGVAKVKFLSPIETKGLDKTSLDQIKNEVYQRLQSEIDENRKRNN